MAQLGINNIGNERREITIDSMDNKRIIEEYYEQLYAHKSGSLNEPIPWMIWSAVRIEDIF